MNTKLVGAMGEAFTADYFRRHGYEIAAMNYRTRFGEIDVIAVNKKQVKFIEVKLRKSGSVNRASDAVGASKQNKLRASADIWLNQNPKFREREISFVVAEVYTSDGRIENTNFIENAF